MSWEGSGFQDGVDGELLAILVVDNQGWEVGLFIKRDDRQRYEPIIWVAGVSGRRGPEGRAYFRGVRFLIVCHR